MIALKRHPYIVFLLVAYSGINYITVADDCYYSVYLHKLYGMLLVVKTCMACVSMASLVCCWFTVLFFTNLNGSCK